MQRLMIITTVASGRRGDPRCDADGAPVGDGLCSFSHEGQTVSGT